MDPLGGNAVLVIWRFAAARLVPHTMVAPAAIRKSDRMVVFMVSPNWKRKMRGQTEGESSTSCLKIRT
jgi:hypothetical protein